MTLLDELIVFFLERKMRGMGIQFDVPRGACGALLEQAMAFELPREEHDVQVCLFIAFDVKDGNEETVRMRYDFPLLKQEFETHPFFNILDDDLIYYRLTESMEGSLHLSQWTDLLPDPIRAWHLAIEGLKDRRGIPLRSPVRRRNLRSGWHRVARYETRVLFYGNERSAHQTDAGHLRVAEEPEDGRG